MNNVEAQDIELQRKEVFDELPTVVLTAPCTINNGIIAINGDMEERALAIYEERDVETAFFIPASGSGSRMFHFLYEYLNDGKETGEVKTFFREIKKFAFFESMPLKVREKVNATEHTSIAAYVISNDGMGYGSKPKGLIPFHYVNGQRLNPFQEQVLQASKVLKGKGSIHFTIQEEFAHEINLSIEGVARYEVLSPVKFSVQSSASDAYCFNHEGEPVKDKGTFLRKPAGHGALLENLNEIEADYVLLKNIDNIQPMDLSELSERYWKIVIGYLTMFKDALREVSYSRDLNELRKLNDVYGFLSQQEIDDLDESYFQHVVSRPCRVCGMVKNEGKPGGGPFWVDGSGKITKQIVEKSQITNEPGQQEILNASTHFNPVFIAVSKTDIHGIPLDLNRYRDESKFLRVSRSHQGRMMHFRELPGLWNGGMHDWNTIFLELPSEVFTPVKSALDLLSYPHYREH